MYVRTTSNWYRYGQKEWSAHVPYLVVFTALTWCSLGVPATSWILLADSQKLSFSTLIMKPISVFWSDKPPRRPSLAQPAWSAKLSRQGRPSLGVDGHDPIFKKITFLKSSWKTVQNMYPPACSDEKFLEVGTPNEPATTHQRTQF